MMEENCKSLIVQFDSFVSNTLTFLDTTIERGKLLLYLISQSMPNGNGSYVINLLYIDRHVKVFVNIFKC